MLFYLFPRIYNIRKYICQINNKLHSLINTRFVIGNVSGQNSLIKVILINDKMRDTTAGNMKNITPESGQMTVPRWLHKAPSNGPNIKPRENAAPIQALKINKKQFKTKTVN